MTGTLNKRHAREDRTGQANPLTASDPQLDDVHTPPADTAPLPPLIRGEWVDPPEHVRLPIAAIDVDRSLNPRFKLDKDVIDDLVRALGSGHSLPPLSVFKSGDKVTLADGEHRLRAHERHGSREVDVEQRRGSRRDAELYAVYANTRHGTKLSRAEVRSAIGKWFDDPACRMWSNAEIARLCGCSGPTVKSVRDEHPLTSKVSSEEVRMVMRGKHRVPVDTHNIGPKAAVKKTESKEPAKYSSRTASVRSTVRALPRRVDDLSSFLDRFEELISEWPEPHKLGRALSEAQDQTVRRRFDAGAEWFGLVVKHYRSEDLDGARWEPGGSAKRTNSDRRPAPRRSR